MLLDPTDDPGSDMIVGSLFTDGGCSLLMDGGRSLLTDFAPPALVGGLLFIEEDEMLPPYQGWVGALECMDIRLESSNIARAEGLSCR